MLRVDDLHRQLREKGIDPDTVLQSPVRMPGLETTRNVLKSNSPTEPEFDSPIRPPDGTPTREITAVDIEDITTQEFTPPERDAPTPPERPLSKGMAGALNLQGTPLAAEPQSYAKELLKFKQALAHASGREIVGLQHQQRFEGTVMEKTPHICGLSFCIVQSDHKMLVTRATPDLLSNLGKPVSVTSVRGPQGDLTPRVDTLTPDKNQNRSRGR